MSKDIGGTAREGDVIGVGGNGAEPHV